VSYVVGVDIGGTFTDCAVVDAQGNITIGKAPSTPGDFSQGVIDALLDVARKLAFATEAELLQATRLFLHACTIGENTLFVREGANTGLIATRGFGDSIYIMRGKITEGLNEAEASHMSALTKPQPYVLPYHVIEVDERIDSAGRVVVPLDEQAAIRAIDSLVAEGLESLAVALLWSTANNVHEQTIGRILQERFPKVHVTLSSEVAPYVGEFERTATTVFNAYIAPKISGYLANLERLLKEKGLQREALIMQAYGGVLDVKATSKNAIGTIESGPSAGVVGSAFLGEIIGEKNILAADMGGTTFKVSVIRDGEIERENNPVLLRYRILSPKIWVESIGAGGGSIAWVDPETNLLKVGPQGAGAKPGPVCYGVGGIEPTVSDADLVLGYLNKDYFLDGRMTLDEAGARKAIDGIARPLGLSVTEAAHGIYAIANAHMSDLMRRATVERGYDPRDFVLFAYGGAGPVHAARYAADLGIGEVLVPATASVHCAAGLIGSNVMRQYGMTDFLTVPLPIKRVNANFSQMCQQALQQLAASGFSTDDVVIRRSVDMRYRYQVHELNVPVKDGLEDVTERDLEQLYERFDTLYEKSYGKGSGYAEAGKEVVTFRVDAVSRLKKPEIRRAELGGQDSARAIAGQRPVYFEEYGDYHPTNLYRFKSMTPGMHVRGPAIIETPVTTIVINPRDEADVDSYYNVRIRIGSGSRYGDA
jgi:N-methylhydantoinase A